MLSLQRLVIRNTTLQSVVILHTRLDIAWKIQVSNAMGRNCDRDVFKLSRVGFSLTNVSIEFNPLMSLFIFSTF